MWKARFTDLLLKWLSSCAQGCVPHELVLAVTHEFVTVPGTRVSARNILANQFPKWQCYPGEAEFLG